MLKDRIEGDLRDAMRARDELRTSALRMLKAAVTNKEVELKAASLDDAGVMTVIGALAKQRRDAAAQYATGNRQDLADRELAELAILQAYLPQQLAAGELAAEVGRAIAQVGAKSPKDMGAVMKALGHLKGRADGKALSDEVRSQLAST